MANLFFKLEMNLASVSPTSDSFGSLVDLISSIEKSEF